MAQKLILVDAYIRVSRISGRSGDSFISPELQRESIERVCEREGLKVVTWYEELDKSGGDKNRPMWLAAIKRVEEGETRGIVCWNLSRFSRSMQDALNALDRIEKAGGKLYSEEGQLSKLDRGFRLLIAEDERDRAKASGRNAVGNAIARGVYVARRIPFGYFKDPETRRLVIDPEKAPIVRELFERRAKGQSWAQLSAWAQETHGHLFARVTLRGMIFNPAYLGHARSISKARSGEKFSGDFLNENAHEAIVSRKLWDSAQKARGRKPVHTGRSASLLLRGIVGCSTCGHKMIVGNTQGARQPNGKRLKIPTYSCRNLACEDHAYGKATEVDTYVIESVLSFLSETTLVSRTHNPKELAQAERDFEDAESALETFKKNRKAITTLGLDVWNEWLEEYVVARDGAQMTVEALREDNPSDEWNLIPDLWAEWTTESRREWLIKFLDAVTIEPQRGQKGIPIQDRVSFTIKSYVGTPMFRVEGGGWALQDEAEGTFDVVTGARVQTIHK